MGAQHARAADMTLQHEEARSRQRTCSLPSSIVVVDAHAGLGVDTFPRAETSRSVSAWECSAEGQTGCPASRRLRTCTASRFSRQNGGYGARMQHTGCMTDCSPGCGFGLGVRPRCGCQERTAVVVARLLVVCAVPGAVPCPGCACVGAAVGSVYSIRTNS